MINLIIFNNQLAFKTSEVQTDNLVHQKNAIVR